MRATSPGVPSCLFSGLTMLMLKRCNGYWHESLLFLQFLHRLSGVKNAWYTSIGKNVGSDFAIDVLIANHSHKATCWIYQRYLTLLEMITYSVSLNRCRLSQRYHPREGPIVLWSVINQRKWSTANTDLRAGLSQDLRDVKLKTDAKSSGAEVLKSQRKMRTGIPMIGLVITPESRLKMDKGGGPTAAANWEVAATMTLAARALSRLLRNASDSGVNGSFRSGRGRLSASAFLTRVFAELEISSASLRISADMVRKWEEWDGKGRGSSL